MRWLKESPAMRGWARRRGLLLTAMMTGVLLASLAAGVAGVLARMRTARAAHRSAARTVSITCPSPSLDGSLPAEVYLPAGYSGHGRRYPVVYFLHGLPAGPQSYTNNGFVAAALQAAHEPAIVVAPQGARSTNSDREYLDWSPQENWPAAISRDLTTCIDSRYHTIADRTGRALMGLSAGGYGAANVGLHNLSQFAAVESWSGYFEATDPSGDHILDLGSPAEQEAATVPHGPRLRRRLAVWPTFIGFYVGRQDSRFFKMNEQFDAALRRTGITHTFAVYPGGHQYSLWQSHARQWLTMALDYLAARHRHPHSRG